MEVYLIRHTTPHFEKGLIYGQLDLNLADSFPEEFELIKQKLPGKFDKVYSSPSKRCTQLAHFLNPSFETDSRLMELNFGEWEGKTWDTVDQDQLQIWMDDFVNILVPGGESMLQMSERVKEFWQEMSLLSVEKIAIVTHAGVIRIILGIVRKLELNTLFEIKVEYGELVVVRL
ncbi:alpha-ribazole phosphatase [Dyadobacter sp. CY312]|uniref:alpha-ribazole phosphatase n=1 Tax=Dyadobacter sp. CY312 TaxID=2907303 RepID=UPI001F461439|nr:alpha-ribazole phosphatase [Dyadobacter sp. CY312]MCE7040854.1 alpha-ribazole phosphatase [Dyadobacter sp. CY312]